MNIIMLIYIFNNKWAPCQFALLLLARTRQDLSCSSITQEDVPRLVTFISLNMTHCAWCESHECDLWRGFFCFFLRWQDYIGVVLKHRMVHPHLSHGHVQGDPGVRDDQWHLLQVSMTLNLRLYTLKEEHPQQSLRRITNSLVHHYDLLLFHLLLKYS